MKWLVLLILLYFVGWVLTYGRTYHDEAAGNPSRPAATHARDAFANGMVWPLYWAFRLSREAFERPPDFSSAGPEMR